MSALKDIAGGRPDANEEFAAIPAAPPYVGPGRSASSQQGFHKVLVPPSALSKSLDWPPNIPLQQLLPVRAVPLAHRLPKAVGETAG